MERPEIKSFFSEDFSLDDIINEHLKNKELFQYAQAVDRYADYLLQQIEKTKESIEKKEYHFFEKEKFCREHNFNLEADKFNFLEKEIRNVRFEIQKILD